MQKRLQSGSNRNIVIFAGPVMSFFEYIRNQHDNYFKAFLFILCVAGMVWLFPKEGKFKYEFQKSQPWEHEDLFAPFDFAINLSESEIEDTRAEIIKNFPPFYAIADGVAEKALANYDGSFSVSWSDSLLYEEEGTVYTAKQKQQHYDAGVGLLTHVYKEGIIRVEDSELGQPRNGKIQVLRDNFAEELSVEEVYTIPLAYQYVQSQLGKEGELNEAFLMGLIERCLNHNLLFDDATTTKVREEELSKMSLTRGVIKNGSIVIRKGDLIDEDKYQALVSLKRETEDRLSETFNTTFLWVGQAIIASIVMLALFLFLRLFRRDVLRDNRKILFLQLLLLLILLATNAVKSVEQLNIYLLPYCILPLTIRTFFDTRLAVFVHILAIITVSFISPSPFEFAVVEILGGVITLFVVLGLRKRSQMFLAAGSIFLIYSISYLGIDLIKEGSLERIQLINFGWFGGSAVLTLLAFPLVYMFEKLFGFVSDVTLLELSDTNNKLLRELNLKAPGTFQHSLQVANLAEEAIREIGGSALLVRTGALYHDIGKMVNPAFFTENQQGGINPHNQLEYEESSRIIVNHVIDGIELAKKHSLPDIIIDFIRTHHGTTRTEYFYRMAVKEQGEDNVNPEDYQYPGPIPYSKETAVLMMADGVEAASKSLKVYDADSIGGLVDSIIDRLMESDQFLNADITFKDINVIRKMFKKKLMSIYHVRIEYPK